ncbi:Pirin [Micractinium conductrix]|uniref:Pirin n=1 Tax=Micractinium conductrix TaxID=554055 RepID=A0A2P6VKB8_9CHLO|nr:Pirin [Micractinium conductrix]|eukprot:PSC74518.1 Pirin [Micractinium conductrix]
MMEGAGVRICRTVGTGALRNLDPFLMLDELKMPSEEATAGFPDHPHRGFETCSIMLSGKIDHADSMGNKGTITDGGVQWMTAGRGVIHSEMPQITQGDLHGFQLWINLPAKKKMCKPQYQDYQAKDIPSVDKDGASVRVLAGSRLGTEGPIKMRNPGMLLDVRLSPGASFTHPVPEAWNGFCYVYEGSGRIGDKAAQGQHAYVLHNEGDTVAASAGDQGLKFLLIAGQPIGEPIVQHGPFVMNHELEIRQAFHDYQTGNLQRAEDNPWEDEPSDEL